MFRFDFITSSISSKILSLGAPGLLTTLTLCLWLNPFSLMPFNNESPKIVTLFLKLVYLQHGCQTQATRVQHECDTNNTSATRVRHDTKCETTATRTARVRHDCYTNNTSATRVRNVDFDNDTSENIFSYTYISYKANKKLQGEKQFYSKSYL